MCIALLLIVIELYSHNAVSMFLFRTGNNPYRKIEIMLTTHYQTHNRTHNPNPNRPKERESHGRHVSHRVHRVYAVSL